MIATEEDIRNIRPIADNINDWSRIRPHIEDAEILDVLPTIGAGIYEQLDSIVCNEEGIRIYTNINNEYINIDEEEWKNILCGCYYTACGCREYTGGLLKAIGFLAYSRLIKENGVNVTAFGVVVKKSDNSNPADEKTIIRIANSAEKKGLEFLRQTVKHLEYLNIICNCCTKPLKRKRKITIIGN